MIDADKEMIPLHFGSNSTDTRIRINLEIWIQVFDHFWLGLDALAGMLSLSAVVYRIYLTVKDIKEA